MGLIQIAGIVGLLIGLRADPDDRTERIYDGAPGVGRYFSAAGQMIR